MNNSLPCNASLDIFIVYTTLSLFLLTCSSLYLSYSDHCSSFVPEAPIGDPDNYQRYTLQHIGFYLTENLSSSVRLRVSKAYNTEFRDLLGVEASLNLETDSLRRFKPGNSSSRSYGYSQFSLFGFWSTSSGKVCMVGKEKNRQGGEFKSSVAFPVLLKLYNLYDSTNITDLVTGTIESLLGSDLNDPNDFEPISIVLFPMLNYEYTLVMREDSRDRSTSSTSDVVSRGLALNSMTSTLCSVIFNKPMGLRFSRLCKGSSVSHGCSPLVDFPGRIPDYLTLQSIECFESRLRLLIRFGISSGEMGNFYTSDPKTMLYGEGVWDAERDRLFVVACRFLNTSESDCSTRLVLRFPSVWTIGNSDSIAGRVWSTKTESDSGFFREFGFRRSLGILSPDMKYEYTMIDKAENWCPKEKGFKSKDMKDYSDALSIDKTFDIRGKTKKSRISTGYVETVSVGNQFYAMRWHIKGFSISYKESSSDSRDVKNQTNMMSYRIHLVNVTWEPSGRLDVSAEGIYNVTTGRLCMVGCRNIGSDNEDALDCDILVDFQFPEKGSNGFITGVIESKRKGIDPLRFESFYLSSGAFVASKAREYAWMEDLEIILALVSNTLACVFAVLQIIYVKRNPDLLPYVSITMLVTLTLGNAIAPMKDLKSLAGPSYKSQDVLFRSRGWVEAKGLIEVITAYLLFFLQARLLQLTWSSRLSSENVQTLWTAENEALVVSLPLYLGAAFLGVFIAWSKRNRDVSTLSFDLTTSYDESLIWNAVKCCVDVLLDGFLVPQVLFNALVDSREKSLSGFFYIGTTIIRVLPHGYGIYKAGNYAHSLASASWDVIVSLGSTLFAVTICLQHKFGGRFIRESNVNVKITNSSVSEA